MGNASYTEDIEDTKQENSENVSEPSSAPPDTSAPAPDNSREEYREIDGEPGY